MWPRWLVLCAVIYSCFDEDGNERLDEEEFMRLWESMNEAESALFKGNYAKAVSDYDMCVPPLCTTVIVAVS